MAKLADAKDLKSFSPQGECGFKSRPGHHLRGSIAIFSGAPARIVMLAALFRRRRIAYFRFWAETGAGSEELLSWVRTTSIHNNPYLRAHGVKVAPCRRAMHSGAALEQTVNRLHAAGLESFCLDLTRAEIRLPVARVFVRGLRHFWARLGPGRLYEVPVRQSLLPTAHTEADLNPVPCMI